MEKLEFNNTIAKIKKDLTKRNYEEIEGFKLELHQGNDFIDLNIIAYNSDNEYIDDESYLSINEPTNEQIEMVKKHFKGKRMEKTESIE